MVLPILGANTADDSYEISNSLRFNDDDSPELYRTLGSPTNNKIYTFSLWLKRSDLTTTTFIGHYDGSASNPFVTVQFQSTGRLRIDAYDNDTTNVMSLITNALFRDTAAWYHIVIAFDTTQGTASNRVNVYVNGNQVTSFSTENYPSQNKVLAFNKENTEAYYGVYKYGNSGSGGNFYDGYIAELHFIDGQQKAQTDFGEFNDNGVWIPIEYTGTYGNNGHFFEFKQTGTSANASGIGADTSGNDNHFTPANLAAIDITTDTCTNNFATMDTNTAGSAQPVLREGNTKQHSHGTANSAAVAATIMPDAGKWYVELKLSSPSGGDYPFFGITDNRNLSQQDGSSAGDNGSKMAAGFEIDGQTNNQSNTFLGSITNTNTGWPSFSDEDIVQFALDLDNRKLWIGRNGTYINSGNPAAGSNEQLAWTLSTNVSVCMLGYDGGGGGGAGSLWNFGNPAYTVSSSNADANGHGNFEYSVPSGYFALCSKNLAEIS